MEEQARPKIDYTISAVQKALKILQLFDHGNSELPLTEISRRMGMNKSTALRFVATLRNEGFLKMDPDTKKYSLGVILFRLGSYVHESMNIQKIANPHIKKAADATGMIVHLGVIHNDEVIVVEKVWPDKTAESVRLISRVGGILPLHCTGIGKIFLAARTDEEIRAIIEKKSMAAYTSNTITDIDRLLREIAAVRRDRYASNNCEHEDYMMSLTYPIYNHKSELVAAMSLACIKEKFKDADPRVLHQVLQDTTAAISRELGTP